MIQSKPCRATAKESAKIWNRKDIRDYLAQNKQFFENLTKVTGSEINDIFSASDLYGTLVIEISHDYFWNKVWTKEEELNIVKKLSPVMDLKYKNMWDSPIIQRLRAGGLVRELNNNMKKVIDNTNQKKMYVYSTHDSQVALLMEALNIFNYRQPPFGTALYLELHENAHGYFVRAYYHNETEINSVTPHPILWGDCSGLKDCPINEYFNSTQHLLYTDFDKECNQ